MATRTGNRSSNSNRSTTNRSTSGGNRSRSSDRSAFNWGDSGALVGAAIAGAAIAVAANMGRKAVMQGLSASAGDWDEVLASEHDAALMIFDKLLATDDGQTFKRTMLLKKLTHALDKHAHEEEHVVYPALRDANDAADADLLEGEHGYVKTFLFDLNEMEKDAPEFAAKVREFRALVQEHAKMEEEQVFPRLKRELSPEQNDRITSLVNKAGFMMA
jgi:hemerythrin superfamily protein